MTTTWRRAALVILAAIASPAWAHHSFAMFDQTKQVTLKGVDSSFGLVDTLN